MGGDGAAASQVENLRELSIEQLGELQVTSAAKRPESLGNAAAAIYVITHDEIARSGATTLPEILRLAPNLQVYQTGASQWVITARGFDGANAYQSFSNKLLVLIDGRSVYTPMFSGVYWDMQDVVVDDIDRIEIISGPGATLWGANAVNGVINITTRKASETQGALVDLAGGNLDGALTVRYGGRAGDSLAYRAYFKETVGAASQIASGASAHDEWSRPQGGFRLDWTPTGSDTITLQGDAMSAAEAQAGAPNEDVQARNLTARWDHAFADGQTLQAQAYYDFEQRATQDGGGSFYVNNYDLEAQDAFALGARNQVVLGGGARISQYAVDNASSLLFEPSSGQLRLFDAFAQDTFALSKKASVIFGLKLEDDPYSGVSILPNLRLSWNPSDDALVWASVSRAIRSPTPFDDNVIEKSQGKVFLIGDPTFRPETLTAYELGTRLQPSARASFSVSAYYNVYDDLRSIEPNPATFTPLVWGNGLQGRTYGVEIWGDWRVLSWWRLSPGFDALHEQFTFNSRGSGFLGVTQIADDPSYHASLKSSMNLSRTVSLDADLRYVSELPDPRVPAYVELNARLGWDITSRLQVAIAAFNLLHARHQELPQGTAIPRCVLAELRWHF